MHVLFFSAPYVLTHPTPPPHTHITPPPHTPSLLHTVHDICVLFHDQPAVLSRRQALEDERPGQAL